MEQKLEKIVLLPDIHHPYQDKPAVGAVFNFIEYFKPNEIVLMGDAMEMRSIDHWKQEKKNIEKEREICQKNKKVKKLHTIIG